MKKFNFKKTDGISLLEVMLSLAIIAVILVLAIRFFGAATRGSNVNLATTEYGQVNVALRNMVVSQGTEVVQTADMPALCQAGLDEKICGTKNDGTGTNPWGGDFSLSKGCLKITGITSLPACQSLATNINGKCGSEMGGNAVSVGMITGTECGTP